MKRSRRRLATLIVLGLGSLFCVALVLVRNVHTGNVNFRYLIWNLFLAWIPFAVAVFVYDRFAKQLKRDFGVEPSPDTKKLMRQVRQRGEEQPSDSQGREARGERA